MGCVASGEKTDEKSKTNNSSIKSTNSTQDDGDMSPTPDLIDSTPNDEIDINYNPLSRISQISPKPPSSTGSIPTIKTPSLTPNISSQKPKQLVNPPTPPTREEIQNSIVLSMNERLNRGKTIDISTNSRSVSNNKNNDNNINNKIRSKTIPISHRYKTRVETDLENDNDNDNDILIENNNEKPQLILTHSGRSNKSNKSDKSEFNPLNGFTDDTPTLNLHYNDYIIPMSNSNLSSKPLSSKEIKDLNDKERLKKFNSLENINTLAPIKGQIILGIPKIRSINDVGVNVNSVFGSDEFPNTPEYTPEYDSDIEKA